MKCYKCKVDISGKFAHAITQNICPACGGDIMDPNKAASYKGLQQLIKNNFPDVDSDKLANLIVANFDLTQLFRDEGPVVAVEGKEEVVVKENNEEDPDAAHKEKQMRDAKIAIRQQEYENALRAQWGMGDDEIDLDNDIESPDGFFDSEDDNPISIANKMKIAQKQKDSYKNMVSGGGAVKRSG